MAILSDGKNYHFGQKGSQTYAEGASNEKRLNYIKRHKVLEDFTKVGPASLSRYVLWEKPSIKQGIKEFNRKLN